MPKVMVEYGIGRRSVRQHINHNDVHDGCPKASIRGCKCSLGCWCLAKGGFTIDNSGIFICGHSVKWFHGGSGSFKGVCGQSCGY